MRLIIKRALIKHVPDYGAVSSPELPSVAHKSDIRMGKLLAHDETSLEGTTAILRQLSDELKLENERILTHGDQLTVSRIIGAQEILENEDTPKNRLANFIPIPGGFHFRWKVLRLLMQNWWGDKHVPGALAHARVILDRLNVSQDAKNFAHTHELVEDTFEAHILALFWRLNGHEEANPRDIDTQVQKVLDHLKTASNGEEGHEHFTATLVLGLLVYLDSHWATKAGTGSAILDNERVALLYLLGSEKSKNYKVCAFDDIVQTLYLLPPYYSHLSLQNRAVNMQGQTQLPFFSFPLLLSPSLIQFFLQGRRAAGNRWITWWST